MRRNEMKSTAITEHGKYKICTRDAVDRESYRLRFDALRLNDDYLKYCKLSMDALISGHWQALIDEDFRAYKKSPEIGSILSAVNGDVWAELPAWLKLVTPNEICLLIYGNLYSPLSNIENLFKFSYSRFVEAYRRYQIWRQFDKEPIYIMDTGEVVPAGRLVVSINPRLLQEEIRKLFSILLTDIKTKKTRNSMAIKRDPLAGYFEMTSKGREGQPAFVCRCLDVAKIKRVHPNTWLSHAKNKHYSEHNGSSETIRRSLLRDARKGANIAHWVVLGRFPKTSKIPS
jgi:hypothetical protein